MSTNYNTSLSDSVATYPSHSCDPRDKNYDWVKQYARAAYKDSRGIMPLTMLPTSNLRMAEIKMYGLGKQPVDKYKKMLPAGNPTDESWRAIDWTVPAFMCKYREIAISKLLQKQFDLQAFAIDPIAKSEEDKYFTEMKIKIIARESVQRAGGNPDDFVQLRVNTGEPEDLEQLAIQKQFTYKHAMAMQAENGFNLVFQQNDIEELRKQTVTSLYDYGMGGYTQWIDENGMTKQRAINWEYFGCSYFEKPNGSDMVHWFEIIPTYIADLAPYYTKEQLDDICDKAVRKNGNPATYIPFNGYFNQAWNRFKVYVMQIKFLSWNDTIYKSEIDGRSNVRFGKSSYQNRQFAVNKDGELEGSESITTDDYFAPLTETGEFGEPTPKYIKSTKKVVYKASWIVETDYMHNYGLQENQNRKLSSWWDTDLDVQLYGWNFYKMQYSGITERLIPLEDRACMAWFNLQNLSNKLIPYLINIEMNAIEGAFPFGKGGEKGKPADVIDFIFSNFIVPYRATDLQSRNPNFKPVSIESTGQLAAFSHYYEELQMVLEMMRQISGMNEVTDGSTVNPKNLNSTNEAMVDATNNAIYLVSDADKSLLRRTADVIVQKIQIAVQLGKVEGYVKALGKNTVDFFSINPNISLHELGIFIDDAPTKAQREALWQDASIKESQGLLTIGDKAFVMTVRNLREAYALLDYKIEQRKQQQHQQQMELVAQQGQQNQQVAIVASQAKQQEMQMQAELDIQKIIIEKEYDFRIEQMKKSTDLQGEIVQAEGRNIGHQIQGQAKLLAAHIVGELAKEKQEIANKKPKPKVKT